MIQRSLDILEPNWLNNFEQTKRRLVHKEKTVKVTAVTMINRSVTHVDKTAGLRENGKMVERLTDTLVLWTVQCPTGMQLPATICQDFSSPYWVYAVHYHVSRSPWVQGHARTNRSKFLHNCSCLGLYMSTWYS